MKSKNNGSIIIGYNQSTCKTKKMLIAILEIDELKPYSEHIKLFPPLKGISTAFIWTHGLNRLNSCINPYTYILSNTVYRKELKLLFCGCIPRKTPVK